MDSRDEFVHSYPKPLDAPWKENWYFNFIDRPNRAFPLRLLEEPLTQQAPRVQALWPPFPFEKRCLRT